MVTAVGICLLALGSVIVYTAARGVKALDWYFFTHSMNGVGPRDDAGGAYHSIVGTLEQGGMLPRRVRPRNGSTRAGAERRHACGREATTDG